ncbi:MAG: GntR family transcriptional regulator [Candidatus Marinimicrobia bacterium]|jgi:LacI family transcriptional regulator|nr:GntR family transcriptional regulator [Candidatus Neomarinimicrobiota bacterium]
MMINKKSPVPKYFQLQTWLQDRIEQGYYATNEKIPTENELVKLSGLSRATVRQALRNLENDGYIIRKKRLGSFVQKIEKKSTNIPTVGILIPDIRSGYAPILARGAEDEATKNNVSLILCNTDDMLSQAGYHIERLIKLNVSGIIYIPVAASDQKNLKVINKLIRKKIPVVLADRGIQDSNLDFVTTNNFDGSRQITQHLINNGHERIAFLSNNLYSTERLRYDGFMSKMKEHNINQDPSITIRDKGAFNVNRYLNHAHQILKNKRKFTAVYAGHDRIALLFYAAAKNLGMRVPDDFSLVGYDNMPLTTVSLTTMHQPIYEMGQESLRLIISRMNNEKSNIKNIILNSNLIERSSVRTIK